MTHGEFTQTGNAESVVQRYDLIFNLYKFAQEIAWNFYRETVDFTSVVHEETKLPSKRVSFFS